MKLRERDGIGCGGSHDADKLIQGQLVVNNVVAPWSVARLTDGVLVALSFFDYIQPWNVEKVLSLFHRMLGFFFFPHHFLSEDLRKNTSRGYRTTCTYLSLPIF